MSQGNSPEKSHAKSTSEHVADKGDVTEKVVCAAKTIKVEMYDEVYYPIVTMMDAVKTAEAIKIVDTTKTAEVVEATKTPETIKTVEIAEPTTPRITSIISTPKKAVHRKRGIKVFFSKITTITVVVVAVVAVALVGLRLFGFRTFTVMSGSMEPNYPVGALIYVKPVDYQNLKAGDVISYVANDDKTVVTHRIAKIEIDEADPSVWRFQTKGDANAVADSKLVHYKNVLGTPIVTIPYIGYIARGIQQPPGIYIALVVGTLLLAWTFLPRTLGERRRLQQKSVA
ncbi:signal peptidase I [Candidatus Saccharibacteria bacterium]|nr:signal peptidase I [Candidatus Saccharibacteria bacterium]